MAIQNQDSSSFTHKHRPEISLIGKEGISRLGLETSEGSQYSWSLRRTASLIPDHSVTLDSLTCPLVSTTNYRNSLISSDEIQPLKILEQQRHRAGVETSNLSYFLDSVLVVNCWSVLTSLVPIWLGPGKSYIRNRH